MKRFFRILTPLFLLALFLVPASAATAEDSPFPEDWDFICYENAWEGLRLVNKYRMAKGYAPLSVFPELQSYVNARARETAAGSETYSKLSDYGLHAQYLGELTTQADSPAAALEGWRTGHYNFHLTSYTFLHAAVGHNSGTWHFTGFDDNCYPEDLYVWSSAGELRLEVGQTIDDLDAVLVYTCPNHGTCYTPLISEMCSVLNGGQPDTSTPGAIRVQVNIKNDYYCYFTLLVGDATEEDLPPVNGTFTEGYFTAEIVNGEATITRFTIPYFPFTWLRLPSQIAGCPVVKLGDSLFEGLYLWGADIYLPDTLTEIGRNVFRNTTIGAVHLPDGMTEISPYAFQGASFTSIDLPESLEIIGEKAFYNSSLTELPYLPNLKEVEAFAFANTAVSGTLRLPAGLTTVGQYAFSGLPNVTAFEVDEGNPALCALDGVLYGGPADAPHTLIRYPVAKTDKQYTVPASVTVLECKSFENVTNLDRLYVLSPRVYCQTFTFTGSDFQIFHKGCTKLAQQLENSTHNNYILLHVDSVELESKSATVRMSYKFNSGSFYLASYDDSGRMTGVAYCRQWYDGLYPYAIGTYEVPITADTTRIVLYGLTADLQPLTTVPVIWEAT